MRSVELRRELLTLFRLHLSGWSVRKSEGVGDGSSATRAGHKATTRQARSGRGSKVHICGTYLFWRSILEPTITQGMEFMPQKLMILS